MTSLESSAAWYVIVKERFVEKQGAIVVVVLVVEVFASRHTVNPNNGFHLVVLSLINYAVD